MSVTYQRSCMYCLLPFIGIEPLFAKKFGQSFLHWFVLPILIPVCTYGRVMYYFVKLLCDLAHQLCGLASAVGILTQLVAGKKRCEFDFTSKEIFVSMCSSIRQNHFTLITNNCMENCYKLID